MHPYVKCYNKIKKVRSKYYNNASVITKLEFKSNSMTKISYASCILCMDFNVCIKCMLDVMKCNWHQLIKIYKNYENSFVLILFIILYNFLIYEEKIINKLRKMNS